MSYTRVLLTILVVLLILSVPFWIWDIDIWIQSQFFESEKGGWHLQNQPFWKAIYTYGIFPGILVASVSLFAVAVSYWNEKFTRLRKPALFLIFSLLLGPGILVNLIFKDHYGRPRPREIFEFGGTEPYAAPLVYSTSGGKSFPCGHGSIGFYLALPFLFLRRNNKIIAYTFLIVGSTMGGLLSFARVTAGGHFTSDVIWAAGMVWIAALAVAHWIKLEEPVKVPTSKKVAKRMFLGVGLLLPVITVGLLLGTPYISSKELKIQKDQIVNASEIRLILPYTKVRVIAGEDLSLSYHVYGFGFPNSRLLHKWHPETVTLDMVEVGWFTEINIEADLSVPSYGKYKLKADKVIGELPSNVSFYKKSNQ